MEGFPSTSLGTGSDLQFLLSDQLITSTSFMGHKNVWGEKKKEQIFFSSLKITVNNIPSQPPAVSACPMDIPLASRPNSPHIKRTFSWLMMSPQSLEAPSYLYPGLATSVPANTWKGVLAKTMPPAFSPAPILGPGPWFLPPGFYLFWLRADVLYLPLNSLWGGQFPHL